MLSGSFAASVLWFALGSMAGALIYFLSDMVVTDVRRSRR